MIWENFQAMPIGLKLITGFCGFFVFGILLALAPVEKSVDDSLVSFQEFWRLGYAPYILVVSIFMLAGAWFCLLRKGMGRLLIILGFAIGALFEGSLPGSTRTWYVSLGNAMWMGGVLAAYLFGRNTVKTYFANTSRPIN